MINKKPEVYPKILTINNLNFESVVLESEIPVLLAFGGIWDFYSRLCWEYLEWVQKKYYGKLRPVIVDYDVTPHLFCDYKVFDLPTIMIMEDGKEFKRLCNVHGNIPMCKFIDYFFGVLPY